MPSLGTIFLERTLLVIFILIFDRRRPPDFCKSLEVLLMPTLVVRPDPLTEMEEPERCFRDTLCVQALARDDKRYAWTYLFLKYWRKIPTLPTTRPFKVVKIGDRPDDVLRRACIN